MRLKGHARSIKKNKRERKKNGFYITARSRRNGEEKGKQKCWFCCFAASCARSAEL